MLRGNCCFDTAARRRWAHLGGKSSAYRGIGPVFAFYSVFGTRWYWDLPGLGGAGSWRAETFLHHFDDLISRLAVGHKFLIAYFPDAGWVHNRPIFDF